MNLARRLQSVLPLATHSVSPVSLQKLTSAMGLDRFPTLSSPRTDGAAPGEPRSVFPFSQSTINGGRCRLRRR